MVTMLEELAVKALPYTNDACIDLDVTAWSSPTVSIRVSPDLLLMLVARAIAQPNAEYALMNEARDKLIATLRQMLADLDAKRVQATEQVPA